jgi:hypothetical protein
MHETWNLSQSDGPLQAEGLYIQRTCTDICRVPPCWAGNKAVVWGPILPAVQGKQRDPKPKISVSMNQKSKKRSVSMNQNSKNDV